MWVTELEIQLTSISHGTTFLFAIYQLSKGCEYTVNMYIARYFWWKFWHWVYKLNTQRGGTVKLLSLHRVSQSHSASSNKVPLSALSNLLWDEIVPEAAVCLICCRSWTVCDEWGLQEKADRAMNKQAECSLSWDSTYTDHLSTKALLSWLTPTASVTTGEIQPLSSWSSLNFASTNVSAVDWWIK